MAQSVKKNGRYEHVFVDFVDDKTYLVLIADLMSKGDYIEPLIKKFNIQAKTINQSLLLKGDKKNIVNFLGAHDKSMMMGVLKCEKVL